MGFLKRIFGKPEPDLSGLAILASAEQYLAQFGEGRNLEYARARQILALAQYRILNQLD